jgi:TolA-binding protein
MNVKDRFESSVRALRELTAVPADGRASRSRILGQMADRKRRHRNYELAIITAIFLLLIPAVSAGWIQLRKSIRTVAGVPGHAGSPRRAASTTEPSPSLHQRTAPLEEPSLANLPERVWISESEPAVAPSATMPAAQRPTELDLYARAHELHFHGNSPRAALQVWTQYVARFPHGRFIPEAQFNRAVCLVQIGDSAAARRLLTQLVRSTGSDHPKEQVERLLAELR